MSDAPALTICRFSRPLSWLRFALGGVISAIALVSVNAESPSDLPEGVSDSVGEWEWLWDEQTLTGAFDVPSTYYDRRHGRTYMRGAVTLRYQLRIPEDRERIRGIIVLVPGLDQHSGRYRHIVNEFKDEFILTSCDTRFMGLSNPLLERVPLGHPQNPDAHLGIRRIRKFFYIVYDFDEFVRSVLPVHLAQERITFEDQPLLLFGHSLGGLTALDYVLGNDLMLPPSNLTGVILSSPALGPPRGVPSISQKILLNYNYDVNASFGKRTEQRTLAGTLYEQTRNIFFTPIFYLASLTRIPAESGWASEWVTDDPWEQIGFQVDPITLRENPLNFIYQVQEHMIEISWRMEGLSKPFLLFYPQGDQIVSPIGARRFAELAEENHHLNRVVSVGDSFAHELFRARPAVRDRLLGEMRDWLDAVLNQPSGS